MRQAFERGQGRFYGVGVSTGRAGYFLSEAIRNENGNIIGVVAIKIDLHSLEQNWLRGSARVLVSDTHGVAFLASDDHLRYRLLHPLTEASRQTLAATRQYPAGLLNPLRIEVMQALDADAALIQLTEATTPARLLDHPIGLASRPGCGSVFWIRVPLARTTPIPLPAPANRHSTNHGCPAAGSGALMMIRWSAPPPAPCCDAGAARSNMPETRRRPWQAAQPDAAPELLLLDLKMGELGGAEVFPRLRERWGASPQVILISAERGADIPALAAC